VSALSFISLNNRVCTYSGCERAEHAILLQTVQGGLELVPKACHPTYYRLSPPA
jgi:hypothetical protein